MANVVEEIEVNLGCCYVIIFVNEKLQDNLPRALVCASKKIFNRQLERLNGLTHVKILSQGLQILKVE